MTRTLLAALALSLILPATDAMAGESIQFRFEKLFPTLQQPWYFAPSGGIAVDENDFVYVAESNNDRVRKFNRSGLLVTGWGRTGGLDGEFFRPHDVALDDGNRVYVSDRLNHRIQVFTRDGAYLDSFGSVGSGPGQLNQPMGIEWFNGRLYVADRFNFRVSIFSDQGQFISAFGTQGTGLGEFQEVEDVDVSPVTGNVYVIDRSNGAIGYDATRIQYFDADGNPIGQFGQAGSGGVLGTFNAVWEIEVDQFGIVYAADPDGRIQRFTGDGLPLSQFFMPESELPISNPSGLAKASGGRIYVRDLYRIAQFLPTGQFIDAWTSAGDDIGQFYFPFGIAAEADGDLLVAEIFNHRVQVLDPDGTPRESFGTRGPDPGQFEQPSSIAVHSNGDIFVVDRNDRVSVFSPDYTFLRAFGSSGTGDGQFLFPSGIAIDSVDNLYVADRDNCRVQKFDAAGNYLGQWGTCGDGDGQFREVGPLVVGPNGRLYVSDRTLHRIQIFETDGQFVGKFGSQGSGPGEFVRPENLAFDTNGLLYVADTENDRYQVFTTTGEYVAKYEISGIAPGSINRPGGIYFDSNQQVFMVGARNNRIQRFSRVQSLPDTRVIMVAGGGPYAGNPLWDATQVNANFAYRTLVIQGFTKPLIHYLTPDTTLDLDQNGQADEVSGIPSAAALEQAITGDFASSAQNLLLYLVDHGGENTFRLTESEVMSASALDGWLDQWQAAHPGGKVTVIYDACQSGSFLDDLAGPDRVLIASAAENESAYFVSQGSLSFSNRFWTQIFNGATVGEAYDAAAAATSAAFPRQNPLLDANGDGLVNTQADRDAVASLLIGSGEVSAGGAPVIGSVSPPQNPAASTATITASDVTDEDGVARVWAILKPPGFAPDSADNPVQDLPTVDLIQEPGTSNYTAQYSQFSDDGVYEISIEAQDRIGNTALPMLTSVTIGTPIRRRAVVLGAGDLSDSRFAAFKANSDLAVNALNVQGYGPDGIACADADCDDVYYMTNGSATSADATANLTNAEFAITTWGTDGTTDLTLYIVGPVESGSIRLNATQTLDATLLDGWLDQAQATLPGVLTVVVDADAASDFVFQLAPGPGQTRYLVASSDSGQAAAFEQGGVVSFSRYFWNQTLNGARLRPAFQVARQAVAFAQSARFDADGNGVPNEFSDILASQNYAIGAGIALAGDDPFVGQVGVNASLVSDFETVTAGNVTSTGQLAQVLLLVSRPDGSLVSQPLTQSGNGYSARSYGLCAMAGDYQVAVVAIDQEGNASLPATTSASRSTACTDFQFFSGFE